jgi:hypothetical protein
MSEGIGAGLVATSTVVAPLVASIKHPVLKRLGKQNIRTFLTERDAYVREIQERSAQENGTVGRPVSLTFSIDPPVLESLVELGQFGAEVTRVDLVTDPVLRKWLDNHQDIKKDGLSAAQVQTIVNRSLRINMAERDCEQRILMLFADYKSLLRLNGMAWLVYDNPKLAVSHITDALKPSVLKKRIRDDLSFGHIGLKKDFLLFMKHVISRAERYADYDEPDATSSGSAPKIPGARPEKVGPMAGYTRDHKSQSHTGTPAKSNSGVKNKSPPDCLNPKCSLKHYLKECANTTPARKDELYAELAERRKNNGEQRITRRDTTATAVTSLPAKTVSIVPSQGRSSGAKSVRADSAPSAGRVQISFQSVADSIALLDSGADDNVIPRSLVQRLEDAGVFVPVRNLNNL